jgi:hypothetical protein
MFHARVAGIASRGHLLVTRDESFRITCVDRCIDGLQFISENRSHRDVDADVSICWYGPANAGERGAQLVRLKRCQLPVLLLAR